MKTLIEILATVVAQNSSRIAVLEGETAVSYAALEKAIVSLAMHLANLGIRPGDRVAILLPNGTDFITSYFAVVLLHGIVVPLNEHYQQSELAHFLKETAASFIITSRQFESLCRQVIRSNKAPAKYFLWSIARKKPAP
jgi:acyl-CoA synthetase (AMP-forming)/AMP-acid ligase II